MYSRTKTAIIFFFLVFFMPPALSARVERLYNYPTKSLYDSVYRFLTLDKALSCDVLPVF